MLADLSAALFPRGNFEVIEAPGGRGRRAVASSELKPDFADTYLQLTAAATLALITRGLKKR